MTVAVDGAGGGGPGAVYELTVNGAARRVEGAHPGDSLLHVLRDRLGLPGAKNACEQGECGSCSVLVDGVLVCACRELAEAAVGCDVTTVELASTRGTRTMPVSEFLTGPKQTARQPDELVVAVRVPVAGGPPAFLKIGVRNALVIAVASCALVVDRERRAVRA